jgi:aminoglycoside 6'-N-acetyltransferase I
MSFNVRQMTASDSAAWIDMRAGLWPNDPPSAHPSAIAAILAGSGAACCQTWGFIAETADGAPAAFAELSIRKYANGCESEPVPFLEAVFVRPQFRRLGIGVRLIAHMETFLTARGFSELGSDALIGNHASHAAHRGWGFAEMERVVYFRKALKHTQGS